MNIEDILDIVSKLATVIAALYGVIFGLRQYARSRLQRRLEYRWTQAEKAKTLLDEMFNNPKCRIAARLLEEGRTYEYEIGPGKLEPIAREEVSRSCSS